MTFFLMWSTKGEFLKHILVNHFYIMKVLHNDKKHYKSIIKCGRFRMYLYLDKVDLDVDVDFLCRPCVWFDLDVLLGLTSMTSSSIASRIYCD